MKEEEPMIHIQNCHCCCCKTDGQQFLIPVSFQPSTSQVKVNTLLDTSDQQQDIKTKFERYNPNLAKLFSQNTKPINYQRPTPKIKQKKPIFQKTQQQTVKTQNKQYRVEQKKGFQFKNFEYIDEKSAGCNCNKNKFTKFIWKPQFTRSGYTTTLPNRQRDKEKQQGKGHEEQFRFPNPEPYPLKVNAQTQTKQKKPTVTFPPDISIVNPPKNKPSMTGFIPKQLDVSEQKSMQPTPKFQKDVVNSKQTYKIKQSQESVFKQLQDNKLKSKQQSSSCDCSCHTKMCTCRAKMKRQLMDQATMNAYFAEGLINNTHSELCECILSSCSCNCHVLKSHQLPQYRLDPRNYNDLPANQMNEIPYAGKLRRYDFNNYC